MAVDWFDKLLASSVMDSWGIDAQSCARFVRGSAAGACFPLQPLRQCGCAAPGQGAAGPN